MIAWLILVFWMCAILSRPKNPAHTIILIAITQLLWGIYDLSIQEYAQSIPFFLYFLWISLHLFGPHQVSQR